MAVDGFARALGFAAATAESVSALEQKVDTSVEEVNETLNTTKTEITNELNTTKEELNTTITTNRIQLEELLASSNEELQNEIDQLNADLEAKRVKVFDSNIVTYKMIEPEIRRKFDIAIAAPPVELNDEQLSAINTMVGDAGETIINMSERELNDQLDKIIGGE